MVGLQEVGDAPGDRRKRSNNKANESNITKLIRTVKERDMLRLLCSRSVARSANH
jgi:hypothetical protein